MLFQTSLIEEPLIKYRRHGGNVSSAAQVRAILYLLKYIEDCTD